MTATLDRAMTDITQRLASIETPAPSARTVVAEAFRDAMDDPAFVDQVRMATAFAVSLMASGATEEEAARAMFRGGIRAQDAADAAAWLVRVAMAMKAHEDKKPVA